MTDEGLLFGRDLFGEPVTQASRGFLADQFMVPPFTVLDGRVGWWKERKRAWVGLGIKSELGRDEGLAYNWKIEGVSSTSVFDPVLTEFLYRSFVPPGGLVLDPFAGGSVRGVVAGLLGYRYRGIELRGEQVMANRDQGRDMGLGANRAEWIQGDSLDVLGVETSGSADFLFSCPPYGDLERYSDDPRDLSTMDYHHFLNTLGDIIRRGARALRADRFACFVVGDFRDPRGLFRGFVADTIRLFREASLSLYNDGVLLTSVGSASMRAESQWEVSRKLAKVHQNVLVFVKGDPRAATLACRGGSSWREERKAAA